MARPRPSSPQADRPARAAPVCNREGNRVPREVCRAGATGSAGGGRASRKQLPLNATDAIGALCCEMGFDWRVCRGLGVMTRAVGLVGHLLEEARTPIAQEVWYRIEDEASEHLRPEEP